MASDGDEYESEASSNSRDVGSREKSTERAASASTSPSQSQEIPPQEFRRTVIISLFMAFWSIPPMVMTYSYMESWDEMLLRRKIQVIQGLLAIIFIIAMLGSLAYLKHRSINSRAAK
ncbi:hypothetical protein BX600DRAFT_466397 [Xylariales sp. PMI_506]|nr:hypothetical protein BX600DRAFT_466397 [Xylariales sp. PMI_506]